MEKERERNLIAQSGIFEIALAFANYTFASALCPTTTKQFLKFKKIHFLKSILESIMAAARSLFTGGLFLPFYICNKVPREITLCGLINKAFIFDFFKTFFNTRYPVRKFKWFANFSANNLNWNLAQRFSILIQTDVPYLS